MNFLVPAPVLNTKHLRYSTETNTGVGQINAIVCVLK